MERPIAALFRIALIGACLLYQTYCSSLLSLLLCTTETAMDGQDRVGLKYFKDEGGRDGAQAQQFQVSGRRVVDNEIVVVSDGRNSLFFSVTPLPHRLHLGVR
jgi:hypothetical protein